MTRSALPRFRAFLQRGGTTSKDAQVHLPPVKSKQEPWAESSYVEFDGGFVPAFMGDGGRTVIKGFYVRVYGTITVGTAAWDGRAVPQLISNIAVETVSGSRRWSLSGAQTRVASIYFNGIEQHNEHANVAVGAGQAVDLLLYIPMEKKMTARGVDFALPAEVFSKIAITWASLANAADSGGAVLSAATLNAYILADCRSEGSVEIKAEDSVKSVNFSSQTEHVVKLTGILHDAMIFRETGLTAGGASIAAITDVRCDELGIPPQTRADLKRWYQAKRGYGNVSSSAVGGARFHEPVIDDQLLPVVIADDETAPWDGKVVEQAKFNLGTGAANLNLITRETLPRNEQNYHAQAAKHGLSEGHLEAKTKTGTQPLGQLTGRRGQLKKKVGVLSHPLSR